MGSLIYKNNLKDLLQVSSKYVHKYGALDFQHGSTWGNTISSFDGRNSDGG